MNQEEQTERELSQTLSRAWGSRIDSSKDQHFAEDPHGAALRYRYDKRSMAVLGVDEWHRLFGSED
jgi:hypothetical protein